MKPVRTSASTVNSNILAHDLSQNYVKYICRARECQKWSGERLLSPCSGRQGASGHGCRSFWRFALANHEAGKRAESGHSGVGENDQGVVVHDVVIEAAQV